MRIYYRIKPETANLTAADYVTGFGMDTQHYARVNDARKSIGLPHRDDFKKSWDSRTGFAIDGTRLNTCPHPYHKLQLVERETGKSYIVDAVYKHHYFGYYIMLLIRESGSNSHGTAYWENISCMDPTVIDGIKEAKERFEVINNK